jgi:hypothetical protein
MLYSWGKHRDPGAWADVDNSPSSDDNDLAVRSQVDGVDSDLPANDDTNCGNPASLPSPSVGKSSAPHSACNDLEERDTVSSPERELSNVIGLRLKRKRAARCVVVDSDNESDCRRCQESDCEDSSNEEMITCAGPACGSRVRQEQPFASPHYS